jgi:hypothetical protein
MDIEDLIESKQVKEKLQEALGQVAAGLLPPAVSGVTLNRKIKPDHGWGPKMNLDGTISGANSLAREKSKGAGSDEKQFNQKMMALLEADGGEVDEEKTEREMLAYIEHYGLTLGDLAHTIIKYGATEADNEAAALLMMELEDLGLDTIISIYCARGENFSQKIFKEALKELGLSAASTHKMYKNMDKWRIAAGEYMEADKNLDTEISFSSGGSIPMTSQQAQEQERGDLLAHYHGVDVVGHILPSQHGRQASIQSALADQAASSLAAMTQAPPPATAAAKGKGKKPPVPRPAQAAAVPPSLHKLSMPPSGYDVPHAQTVFAVPYQAAPLSYPCATLGVMPLAPAPAAWVPAVAPAWLCMHEPSRESWLEGRLAQACAPVPTPYLQPEPGEQYPEGDDRRDSYRHAEWRLMHRARREAEGRKVQSGLDLGDRYPCYCRRESACQACEAEWEGKPSSIELRRRQEQLAILRQRADAIEAETARLLALESPMSHADSRSWSEAAEVCTAEAKTWTDDFKDAMANTSPEVVVLEDGTDVEADISALSISLSVSPVSIDSQAECIVFAPPDTVLPQSGRKRAAQGPASPQGPQAPAGKENEHTPKKRAPAKTKAPALKVVHVSTRASGGRVPATRGLGYGTNPQEL